MSQTVNLNVEDFVDRVITAVDDNDAEYAMAPVLAFLNHYKEMDEVARDWAEHLLKRLCKRFVSDADEINLQDYAAEVERS